MAEPLIRRGTENLVERTGLNDLMAEITGRRSLHPSYPSYSAADRDLLQRSHRLDGTAFRSATGWNPRFGPSALAFVPSSQPLARLEMR